MDKPLHEKSMQRGYELKELAEIYGHRGCCKKGTCIHKKAKFAIELIEKLENEITDLKGKGIFKKGYYRVEKLVKLEPGSRCTDCCFADGNTGCSRDSDPCSICDVGTIFTEEIYLIKMK